MIGFPSDENKRAGGPLSLTWKKIQEWKYTSVQADICFYWPGVQVVLKTFAAASPYTADYECFYKDTDKKHTPAPKPEYIAFW